MLRRRLFVAGGVMAAGRGQAQEVAPAPPFLLPPLPYPPAANEPYIDAATVMLHHDAHHRAYVTGLNAALTDYPRLPEVGLARMLAILHLVPLPDSIRAAIRDNGGGHANHTMYWAVTGGKGGAPAGKLAKAIDRDFGSFDNLRRAFNQAGLARFGSGWVFVTVDLKGKLGLVTHPNQDTPLMDGGSVLFGNDLWEHAWYLQYRDRRAEYLDAWWHVVNWPAIQYRYGLAITGTLGV